MPMTAGARLRDQNGTGSHYDCKAMPNTYLAGVAAGRGWDSGAPTGETKIFDY